MPKLCFALQKKKKFIGNLGDGEFIYDDCDYPHFKAYFWRAFMLKNKIFLSLLFSISVTMADYFFFLINKQAAFYLHNLFALLVGLSLAIFSSVPLTLMTSCLMETGVSVDFTDMVTGFVTKELIIPSTSLETVAEKKSD